jgi:hypothetical protein
MKSEQLNELATALSKAQAEMPAAPMLAVNPFLKNKYADLGTIIKTATPILSKNGLAVSQQVVTELDRIGVTTTLLHTSGQWIESTVSLPLGGEKGKSIAQEAGSIVTYLRRYSFGAIIGMYTDEDTDGNQPVKNHEQPAKPYEAKQDPQKSNGKMTIEFAQNETNSKGVKYGDIDTETLANMANALAKMAKRTDDQQRKLTAAQTILANRAASSGA